MELFLESFPKIFISGIVITLPLALVSFIIAMLIAIVCAMIQYAKVPVVKNIVQFYIWIFRGTPMLVQLFIMYFGMQSIGVRISAITAAIIVFSLNTGAYCAETIRGSIESVPQGQMEAGLSLGLSYGKTMRYIILPQAIKNILPALGNEFITLLKETSAGAYIGILELTKASDIIASRTYDYFFPLIITALIYLVMTLGLSKLVNVMERRLSNARS